MAGSELDQRVEAVRRFSRFYTQRIGVLQDKLLRSPFSLPEGRVLYELAHRERTTASRLARELDLDAGYLSRILSGLETRGLIERRPCARDRRRSELVLSPEGRDAFATINARSRHEIAALLGRLSPADRGRLTEAMGTIEALLGAAPPREVSYILRPHQPGDLGWIVQRHGVLYAEEYGWDETFEALVAEVAARFIRTFEPRRERGWIAEMDGETVGCVLLVKDSEETAKLRLLLVEPRARGRGIGRRLVSECIRFARHAGYRKVTLWTNDVLHAARRVYEQAGFRLVHEAPHHSFGCDLIGQTWELDL